MQKPERDSQILKPGWRSPIAMSTTRSRLPERECLLRRERAFMAARQSAGGLVRRSDTVEADASRFGEFACRDAGVS
jgi:hypothetical protein